MIDFPEDWGHVGRISHNIPMICVRLWIFYSKRTAIARVLPLAFPDFLDLGERKIQSGIGIGPIGFLAGSPKALNTAAGRYSSQFKPFRFKVCFSQVPDTIQESSFS